MKGGNKEQALCHPTRPMYGNGMCQGCYHAARFSKAHPLPEGVRRAACHSGLRHYAGGLCVNCYQEQHPRNPENVKVEKASYFQRTKKERTRKNRAWIKDHPGKERIYHLKSNYGLTPEQFDEMVKQQDGACAICHRKFENQTPSVDHDHETDIIRGLLCRTCNQNLGWFEKISIKELLTYLERGNYASHCDPKIDARTNCRELPKV